MAIALNSASGTFNSGTGSTLTFGHTCAGSDRALVVGVGCGNTFQLITGVTYGGVPLTKVTEYGQAGEWVTLWQLLNPAAGTANVVVTGSAAGVFNAIAASFTGVGSFGVSGGAASDFAPSPYQNNIVTPAGGVAVDVICARYGGLTAQAGQTLVTPVQNDGFLNVVGMSYEADSTAMGWSFTNSPGAAHAIVTMTSASTGGGGGGGAAYHYYTHLMG